MYNKYQYRKYSGKKVLHKVRKQWVTISLALLMMIGGGAVATHVSADASQVEKAPVTYVQNNSRKSHSVTNQAKHLHTHLLSNASKHVSHQINTSNSGRAVTVNNKSARKISNVNRLKINQFGMYRKYIYARVNTPFNRVRINHTVGLHASIELNSHIHGYLRPGNIVKISRAFREYGHYGDYLRYEVPLMNKRTAFITGQHHDVSLMGPNTSYRYYQRKVRRVLKRTNGKKFNQIRKSFDRLTKRGNRNYRKYVDLYVEAFNTKQALRHPVMVNYNNKRYNSDKDIINNINSNANVTPTSNGVNNNGSNRVNSVASSSNSAPINPMPAPNPASISASVSASASASASASISASVSASNSAKDASYAQSAAKSADSSIANSYKNSVSALVSTANKSKASSAASSADRSIENSINRSIASSYAKSTENTGSYKNSVAAADRRAASSAAQSTDSRIDASIANSYAKSADSSINSSITSSASKSADNSIATSYRNSVSNSVSSLDKSLAQSAASSADSSIASSEAAMAPIYANLAQAKQQTLTDINNERRDNGLSPLKTNKGFNRLANERAHQLINNFSHYPKGLSDQADAYYITDSRSMGLDLGYDYGENISYAGLRNSYEDGTNNSGRKDPILYYNNNGIDIANMMNDGMMNWDADSSWGHRKNILDRNFNTIGIGVAYDKKTGYYYLSEDFGDL